MKRSPVATARRTVRRAVTWRPKQRGRTEIDVAALVSPLRYDVRVRADFFALVADRPREEPIERLVELARSTSYAEWFRVVAMARFRPWVLEDPALLEDQFRERVESARALFWSFSDRGFDTRYPVVLRRTSAPARSESGALIRPRVHVGDGSHRLALLLHSGLRLAPEMYLVDPRPSPVIDNTVRLFGAEDAESPAYLGFVARGYLDRGCASIEELLDAVRAGAGEAAATEAAGVLVAHRRAWGLPPHGALAPRVGE